MTEKSLRIAKILSDNFKTTEEFTLFACIAENEGVSRWDVVRELEYPSTNTGKPRAKISLLVDRGLVDEHELTEDRKGKQKALYISDRGWSVYYGIIN